MLDQSFSAENFRRILDIENRKGVYLEGKFFPDLVEMAKEIKTLIKDLKKSEGKMSREDFIAYRKDQKEKIANLEAKKEEKLMAELRAISERITSNSFRIRLKENGERRGKKIYGTESDPESYFALKQLQYNFRKLYKVKQASRYAIVSHLKGLLSDKFPKFVVRTDLKSFYETIPHDKLKQKLNADNLLTSYSKRIISQILNQYKSLSNSSDGLPRGIGISAYLAELYMRESDATFRSMQDVSYYARYVDDFVIIFTPSASNRVDDYLPRIDEILEKKFLLERNKTPNKTQTANVDGGPGVISRIDYLGYSIKFGDGDVNLELLPVKVNRYKKKVDLALDTYLNFSKVDKKEARKLLIKRIRYLTGNTRLHNNKSNILVGVYFSNSLLSNSSVFRNLDNYLTAQIIRKIDSVSLQKRLRKYRFEDGFTGKRFSRFTTVELAKMLKIWRTT